MKGNKHVNRAPEWIKRDREFMVSYLEHFEGEVKKWCTKQSANLKRKKGRMLLPKESRTMLRMTQGNIK